MPELYLRLLDRILTPVLLLLGVILLLRGHNLPGGGFIAGLVVAAAFQLQILSRGVETVQENVSPYLQPLIGIGLTLAALAACLGIVYGGFFYGVWWEFHLGTFEIELSTPVVFDIGVFLVVLSVVTLYLVELSRREESQA